MPKIQRTPTGQVRRVIQPSSICNACKGKGKIAVNGVTKDCTNCYGQGHFSSSR